MHAADLSPPSDAMKEEEGKPRWVHSAQVGVGRVSSLSYLLLLLLPTYTKAGHAQDGPLSPQTAFCWSRRKQKTETWNHWRTIAQVLGKEYPGDQSAGTLPSVLMDLIHSTLQSTPELQNRAG